MSLYISYLIGSFALGYVIASGIRSFKQIMEKI